MYNVVQNYSMYRKEMVISMSFETKRSLEIEYEEASRQVKEAFDRWNANRTVENETLLEDAKTYCHQVAYELQKWKMHETLVEKGYEFDSDDEDMVIEFASAWSWDVCEVAEKMESNDLRCITFDQYVEEYVVDDYNCRAGSEGVEIFREFQRWMSTDDFKEFIRNHYTDGEEGVVECFEDDYIIIMNM